MIVQNYTIPLKFKNCWGRFFRVDELMSAPESVMVNLMQMFDGADVSLSGASQRLRRCFRPSYENEITLVQEV
ncbi:MAG: hypothetical protein SO082_00730 [Candidatus Limisoma sp.]|nr:hypothetical protein [Candidatus Limisoma sp.]